MKRPSKCKNSKPGLKKMRSSATENRSARAKEKMVALLRGVNVGGGNRKVPMAELCAILSKAGFGGVRHYINSGNLVFENMGELTEEKEIEAVIEKEIETHFGFHVDVIVRTASEWREYASIARCPFLDAAKNRPNLLRADWKLKQEV